MDGVGQTYEIVEGVRRAKAHFLAGQTTIRAVIQHADGTCSDELEVSIDSLRSPKDRIDLTISSEPTRFLRIWNAVRQGKQVRAITITPGSQGTPVKDVGWIL